MKYVVGLADEIGSGDRKIVEVAGRSIGIFNLDGDFFALRNRCPHQGGPLCQGKLVGILEATRPGEFQYREHGTMLMCPWHRWEFDVRTGQSWVDPFRWRVRSYHVDIEAGSSLLADGRVKGPYVAETFPISKQGRYLVLDLPNMK